MPIEKVNISPNLQGNPGAALNTKRLTTSQIIQPDIDELLKQPLNPSIPLLKNSSITITRAGASANKQVTSRIINSNPEVLKRTRPVCPLNSVTEPAAQDQGKLAGQHIHTEFLAKAGMELPWLERNSMNHPRWKNSRGRPKGTKNFKGSKASRGNTSVASKPEPNKTPQKATKCLTLMSELTNVDMEKIRKDIEGYRPTEITPENKNRNIALKHRYYMAVNYNSANRNRPVSQSLYELVMQGMNVSFTNPAGLATNSIFSVSFL